MRKRDILLLIIAIGLLAILLVFALSSSNDDSSNTPEANKPNTIESTSNSTPESGSNTSPPPVQQEQPIPVESDPIGDVYTRFANAFNAAAASSRAGNGVPEDLVAESGRAQVEFNNMVGNRVYLALKRKYRRLPSVRMLPGEISVDIGSLHNEQGCNRCVHVGYDIFDSEWEDNAPSGDHGHHLVASCSLHISLAKSELDDEVFVDDLSHNLCFEPLTNAPPGLDNQTIPSLNENTPGTR